MKNRLQEAAVSFLSLSTQEKLEQSLQEDQKDNLSKMHFDRKVQNMKLNYYSDTEHTAICDLSDKNERVQSKEICLEGVVL